MKKILVLGGCGFMGKNLNKALLPKYKLYNESRRTECDIRDIFTLKEKLKKIKPDIIINAAANVGSLAYVSKYAADVIHDNTLMYVNLYSAVKDIDPNIKIINPISNCSYPGAVDIQHEKNWWEGSVHESVESYGSPKKVGYVISKCYEKQYGVKTLNLIIPNSYGPEDHLNEAKTHAINGIIIRMIKAKKNNQKKFVVWGSGTPIREWIYMPDVAKLIREVIDGEIFNLPNPINIGQQKGISINQSVEMIRQLLDYDVEIQHDLTKQDGAQVKILGKELFQDWFPNFGFTDHEVGIKETIKYFGEHI